jgi:hypothetical protein
MTQFLIDFGSLAVLLAICIAVGVVINVWGAK